MVRSEQKMRQHFREHSDAVFYHVAPIVGEDVAREVVSDAFLKLSQHLLPVVHVRAWLCKVARNIAIDRCRQENTRRRYEQEASVSFWKRHTIESMKVFDERAMILDTLHDLKPRDAQLLILRECYGFGYDEIADKMDISERSIGKYLQRARKAFAKQYQRLHAQAEGKQKDES